MKTFLNKKLYLFEILIMKAHINNLVEKIRKVFSFLGEIIFCFCMDLERSLFSLFSSNETTKKDEIINFIKQEISYNHHLYEKQIKEREPPFYLSIEEFVHKYLLIPKPLRVIILSTFQNNLNDKKKEFLYNKSANKQGVYFISQRFVVVLKAYEKKYPVIDYPFFLLRVISTNVINCRCRVFDFMISDLLYEFHKKHIKIIEEDLKKNLKRSIKYT